MAKNERLKKCLISWKMGCEVAIGHGGDSCEYSESAKDYDKVGEEVGRAEGAEDDEEVSGTEDKLSDVEEVVGLEDSIIHTPAPYKHRELNKKEQSDVLHSLLYRKKDDCLQ